LFAVSWHRQARLVRHIAELVNGSAAPKLGGEFALEIAPLLGLAGKPAAGTTSCCLSTVATANRAHHATPSYFLNVRKQARYDDTRGGLRGGWRNGPSGRTFGWRNWQDRRRQISFHDVFQKEPASFAVKNWT